MQVHRCPECGGRLKSNYCDICLRKVPFKGAPAKQTWQHVDGSSAHRDEGHECISFDDVGEKPKSFHWIGKPHQTKTRTAKKKGAVVGIILAVISVVSSLFGLVEEAVDSVSPEPYVNVHDGFVEAGEFGAENVPDVVAGELYNANGIRITADSAGLSYGEYAIFMTIHNDTEQDISVSADWFSVNGYMYAYGMYQDLKAGDSVQTSLIFYEDELEKAYITEVAQVEFVLNVYDADSYEDIITGEVITVETEIADSYDQPVSAYGWELYNDGSVYVLIRDMQMDGHGDCQLEVHMENLSGSTASVYVEGVWVNGQEVSGHLWSTLRPDKRDVDSIYLYEMDRLGITDWDHVEEMTLELYVEYMDGWDVVETVSESITFNPNEIR